MTKPAIDPAAVPACEDKNQDQRNRLLLEWLSDDEDRAALYRLINANSGGRLEFHSRDVARRECDCQGFEQRRPPQAFEHRTVTLITDRTAIEAALRNADGAYSNRIYAELGGGSFMLALDPHWAPAHAAQQAAFKHCFPHSRHQLIELSHTACRAAAITALRGADFDLAEFAEQSALRFCQKLMGYAISDHKQLETTLRAGYRALVYQVLGRHFVTDVVAIPAAKQEMARLLTRTSALIDAYAAGDEDDDVLKGCKDRSLPAGLVPVLQRLGVMGGNLNGEQRAIIAIGSAVGTVGNVQAAACIAVQAIFGDKTKRDNSVVQGIDDTSLWARARKLALEDSAARSTDPVRRLAGDDASAWPLTVPQFDAWKALIQDLLRQNPPIPFLPRYKVDEHGNAIGEVILALGGGTQGSTGDDPLIWGLPEGGKHWCAGMELAWPLIIEIVRQVMALPAVAERLDPEDASVIGLKKRWGFACESYPLTHRRESRVAQASLNVAMRLKPPVKDNADRVREVIRSGAPRIEEALRDARHVHFAWFELIESDTVLVLHTVYDGPFAAYIQDFALKVGDLFDLLFECIENPPPMPVVKFPNEFVAHIQRFDRAPAMGYFFSAYPRRDVARILRDDWARP